MTELTCEQCGASFTTRLNQIQLLPRFCTRTCYRIYARETASAKGHTSVGNGSVRHHSKTYIAWRSMKERCLNDQHPDYADYGGRGITICKRWLAFLNFLEDMGDAPVGTTLERKNVDGNYEPDNCIWASSATQARNRRNNILTEDLVREIHGRVEHGESRESVANRLGISYSTVAKVITGMRWAGVA